MGLRDALRLATGGSALPTAQPEILSPWSNSDDLSSIVWADLLDVDLLPLTRAEAMSVPAAARARHLIAGAVAGCPLRVLAGDVELSTADTPAWTYSTGGPVSPWHRMLWTVDDVFFHGWSLWAADRNAAGHVIRADRIPYDRWAFGTDGSITVGDEPVKAADVVLIPGPHEGMLNYAARTLRAAARLERAAARHSSNPVPSIALVQTVDVALSDAERDELVSGWVAARASDSGAVGFASYGIEPRVLGQVPEQLLESGRNAAAVDVARHASMPAAMLDATTAGASLTYETTQGRNAQWLDYGLSLYLDAISARLSLDDVVPRGQRVAFDTSNLTSLTDSPTGPALAD